MAVVDGALEFQPRTELVAEVHRRAGLAPAGPGRPDAPMTPREPDWLDARRRGTQCEGPAASRSGPARPPIEASGRLRLERSGGVPRGPHGRGRTGHGATPAPLADTHDQLDGCAHPISSHDDDRRFTWRSFGAHFRRLVARLHAALGDRYGAPGKGRYARHVRAGRACYGARIIGRSGPLIADLRGRSAGRASADRGHAGFGHRAVASEARPTALLSRCRRFDAAAVADHHLIVRRPTAGGPGDVVANFVAAPTLEGDGYRVEAAGAIRAGDGDSRADIDSRCSRPGILRPDKLALKRVCQRREKLIMNTNRSLASDRTMHFAGRPVRRA